MDRFTGTCEWLAQVDVSDLAAWIGDIDFSEWPQKPDGTPAMIDDLSWHGFGKLTDKLVYSLATGFVSGRRMLSAVLPGCSIERHCDKQPASWITRVHVPLVTDPNSWIIFGNDYHHISPGGAYRINTEVMHSIVNNGTLPRIHLMFDLYQ